MFCSVDRLSAYLILLSPLQMSPAFMSEYFKNASILAWNKCWIDKLYRVASFSLETLPLQLVTDHFVDKNSIFVSFEKVSRLLLLILTAKIKQYWGIRQMCLQHLRLLLAYFSGIATAGSSAYLTRHIFTPDSTPEECAYPPGPEPLARLVNV